MMMGRGPTGRRGVVAKALAMWVGVVGGVSLVGCASSSQQRGEAGASRVERGPAPSYDEVRRAVAERLRGLERVRSSVSLVITTRDERGREREDQVEGNLQAIPPRKLALRLDKVGQTLAYLGSNDALFWAIDFEEPKTLRVGSHARARLDAAREFGLPVHPLDLIDLLGITPLPESGRAGWSSDGRTLLVSVRGRWATRRIRLDPETYEPVRIDLVDDRGTVVLSASLERPIEVSVRGGAEGGGRPRIASRVIVSEPGSGLVVRMNIETPENPGRAMRDAPFDLERLVEAYGVERMIDLDLPSEADESGGAR